MGHAGVTDFLTCALATRVITFNQIPLLPGANLTTDNQAVRKQYVDDTTLPFSVSFFDADP
jgi:hypothetical protein